MAEIGGGEIIQRLIDPGRDTGAVGEPGMEWRHAKRCEAERSGQERACACGLYAYRRAGGAVGEREEPQIHHGNAKRMLRKLYPRLPQTEAGLAMAEEWAAGTGLLNDQRGSVPERILQIEQQAAGEAVKALRWLADDVSAEDVSALDPRVWESLGVARHVLARLSVNEGGPVARTEPPPLPELPDWNERLTSELDRIEATYPARTEAEPHE